MFAVVRTGGKQYRVAAGDKIVIDKIEGEAGARVSLGDVLFTGGGNAVSTVAAEIIAQAKGEKVIVFKKRRRHNYRRKNGHRQRHTILKIVAIGDQKEKKPAPAKTDAKADAARADTAPPATAPKKAAPPKAKKIDPVTPEEGAGDITGKPTPNPAPSNPKVANPEIGSTENAAPAKGAPKNSPKAK